MKVSTIDRFEDFDAWKISRQLTNSIYDLTNQPSMTMDSALCDQLRRAAMSTMLNIAEGFGRKTNSEFARFVYYARGSALEVQSALYVAKDQGYIDDHQFNDIHELSNRTVKTISGLIRYLHSTV